MNAKKQAAKQAQRAAKTVQKPPKNDGMVHASNLSSADGYYSAMSQHGKG